MVENTGAAGDVILLHPLTLHVAAPNNSATDKIASTTNRLMIIPSLPLFDERVIDPEKIPIGHSRNEIAYRARS